MKKLAFIALLLLSFSNVFAGNEFEAPALETAQEIILTEVYDIMPLDDPKDEGRGISFLGCHVVNSTALISQIDECLQEQLIIQ